MKTGQTGVIVRVMGHGGFRKRIVEMGFIKGKTVEVLVEGMSKRSREQFYGRTPQNKVVVFDRGQHRIGDYVKVKVTESSSATLKGIEVNE